MATLEKAKLEDLISRVPGVHAVKVVDDSNGIQEIHVITGSDKSPKQMVRDIETVILATTGMRIDRKVISIAQVQGDAPAKKILPYRLEKIDIQNIDDRNVRISVSVEHGEEEFYGEISGSKTSRNVPRLIGNAILNALSEVHDFAISFDDSTEVYLVGKRFIVVHLTKQYNGYEESVIGTAIIESNFEKAVAEAVLDGFRKI